MPPRKFLKKSPLILNLVAVFLKYTNYFIKLNRDTKLLMFITLLTCFMCHSFPGMLPNRSFFATHKLLFVVVFLVNVLCPGLPSLAQIFLRPNIKALILKILDTWTRKGFGVQRHSACQLPSFKPHMGKEEYI